MMKLKITLSFVFAFLATTVFGVAIEKVLPTEITFYNFSGSSYSIAGKQISVNNTNYEVNNLTIVSGNLNVAAGAKVTLSGLQFSDPTGSIGLWQSGTFKTSSTPTPADLIWFIQYGAAGQPHEAIADQAGLWAMGTFIPGQPPLIRDNDYGTTGSSHWVSTFNVPDLTLRDAVEIGPQPFSEQIIITNKLPHKALEIDVFNILGATLVHMEAIKSTEIRIETSRYKNGIHIIQIRDENGHLYFKRLVKN